MGVHFLKIFLIGYCLTSSLDIKSEILIFENSEKTSGNSYYVLALDTTRMEGYISAVNWYEGLYYFNAQIRITYNYSYDDYISFSINPVGFYYDKDIQEGIHTDISIVANNDDLAIKYFITNNWKSISSNISDFDKALKIYESDCFCDNAYLIPKLKRTRKINYKRIPEKFRLDFEKQVNNVVITINKAEEHKEYLIFEYQNKIDCNFYTLVLDRENEIGHFCAVNCYNKLPYLYIRISINPRESSFSFYPVEYQYTLKKGEEILSEIDTTQGKIETWNFSFDYFSKDNWKQIEYFDSKFNEKSDMKNKSSQELVGYSFVDVMKKSTFLKKYDITWFPACMDRVKRINYNKIPEVYRRDFEKRVNGE